MNRDINCLRCNKKMQYIANEKLQLGQTGWLLGDLSNLLAGALEVSIYCCKSCGKIELFRPEAPDSTQDRIAQRQCPHCGQLHDLDYPSCPFCKHKY